VTAAHEEDQSLARLSRSDVSAGVESLVNILSLLTLTVKKYMDTYS